MMFVSFLGGRGVLCHKKVILKLNSRGATYFEVPKAVCFNATGATMLPSAAFLGSPD